MSSYSDFIAELKDWANRDDWSDALAKSFVRMAEQKFNSELRNDWMVRHASATLSASRVLLPSDWLEADHIRGVLASGKQCPLRYITRDEFFASESVSTDGFYTYSGRYLYVGGIFGADGETVQMDYYGKVPKFSDSQESFLYDQYEGAFLLAAMTFASVHGVDDERVVGFDTNVSNFISKLNAAHVTAKQSGSLLKIRTSRSYG